MHNRKHALLPWQIVIKLKMCNMVEMPSRHDYAVCVCVCDVMSVTGWLLFHLHLQSNLALEQMYEKVR
jgi:hypothetical protein